MIPQPAKWRKQVQISMSPSDLRLLDQLVELDTRKWGGRRRGGKGNRSRTICELVTAELKRRKQDAHLEDASRAK
jgi:hypothetical protein